MLELLWLILFVGTLLVEFGILVEGLVERLGKSKVRIFRTDTIKRLLGKWTIPLIGVLLTILLYLPSAQYAIKQTHNLDTIFVAGGGLIGTIIALIFSLSIIVVQRAAETFTPFVSRLYRNDRRTHLLFIVLVALCLLSFVFSIDGIFFGLSQPKLVPVEVLVIAFTFELSRLQYGRVSRLMDANEALDMLLREMVRRIDHIQKTVARTAGELKRKSLEDVTKGKLTLEQIETYIYQVNPRHVEVLGMGLGEMSEFATRAISNKQFHVAQKAVWSIGELGVQYLNSRKKNILLFPAPSVPLSGLIVGDVDRLLDPLYEQLLEINRRAVESKSQSISIEVVECFGRITIHLLSLGQRQHRIAWKALGYLGFCVAEAQSAQLHDVGLRGSNVVLRFGVAVPQEELDIRVYLPVIERFRDISISFLISRNPTSADLVLKDLTTFLHHILRNKTILFDQTLSLVLPELYRIVPLCQTNEVGFAGPFAPYDMTNLNSLGYMIEDASRLMIEKDSEWNNPYANFIEINERVSSHFRSIADHFDIGSSKLVWELTQTVGYIGDVFLRLVVKPVTDNRPWIDELTNQMSWYFSCFWAAFDNAKKVDKSHSYDACCKLTLLSLEFYERDHPKVTTSGVNAIASIAESFNSKGTDRSVYGTADLLALIWHVRILAEAREDASTVAAIDKELARLKFWQDQDGAQLKRVFEERKWRLKQELTEVRGSFFDDPGTILKRILADHYPAMIERFLKELYGVQTEDPTQKG